MCFIWNEDKHCFHNVPLFHSTCTTKRWPRPQYSFRVSSVVTMLKSVSVSHVRQPQLSRTATEHTRSRRDTGRGVMQQYLYNRDSGELYCLTRVHFSSVTHCILHSRSHSWISSLCNGSILMCYYCRMLNVREHLSWQFGYVRRSECFNFTSVTSGILFSYASIIFDEFYFHDS